MYQVQSRDGDVTGQRGYFSLQYHYHKKKLLIAAFFACGRACAHMLPDPH